MKIQLSYAAEEDVPEAHKELYTEDDGKWNLTAVEGMKTQEDIDRQQAGLKKERDAHKVTKEKLAPWLEMGEHAEIQEKLDKIPELEALAEGGTINEDRMNELVEGRIKTRIAPLERDLKAAKEEHGIILTENNGLKADKITRTIHDEIRVAANKSKAIPEAIQDILMVATSVFEIRENGDIVTTEKNGDVGLSAETWLIEMAQKRPYWWPQSTGGGASGSSSLPGGGKNPFSKDNWNLTEQGKLIKAKGIDTANQMAKLVGSAVGNTKPPEK